MSNTRFGTPDRIEIADLSVEGAEVVNDSDEEAAAGEEVEEAGAPFAHVKAMDAEDTEEGEENPGEGVLDMSGDKAAVGLTVHAWDEEQVHDPADEEEAAGEEPEDAGLGLAEVETVRAREAEDPEKVADELVVRGWQGDVVHDGHIIMPRTLQAIARLLHFRNRAALDKSATARLGYALS